MKINDTLLISKNYIALLFLFKNYHFNKFNKKYENISSYLS